MRNSKLKIAVATTLTAASIAAPSAGARPIDDPVVVAPSAALPAGINGGHGPVGVTAVTQSPTPSTPRSNGFDWGDAAIGAAAALGLLGLGAAATGGFRRSRSGHPALS